MKCPVCEEDVKLLDGFDLIEFTGYCEHCGVKVKVVSRGRYHLAVIRNCSDNGELTYNPKKLNA